MGEVLRRWRGVEARLADASRRAGGEGEYRVEQVIAEVVAGFLGDGPQVQEVVEGAVGYMLDYEIGNTYRDPGIMDKLQSYHANRIWYVSDFYMGKEHLDAILAAHGIALDDGVVSCDIGKNKRRGGLYEYVKAKAGADCQSIIHIGDDRHSDFDQAKKHGIEAVHYVPEDETRLRQERADRFMDREWSIHKIFVDARAECRFAGGEGQDGQDGHDEQRAENARNKPTLKQSYDVGLASAPLFIGFALFIAEYAVRHGLQHIYFFTREGIFFKKVFDALFEGGALAGHKLPSSSVLHVSRLATFSASLNKVNNRSLMRLWQLHSRQSLEDLFRSLNMAELIDEVRAKGIDCSRIRRHPWWDAEVISLLGDHAFQARIEKRREELRNQLCGYLRQNGFYEHDKMAVIDIGWRGTIQDNLAYLNPKSTLHGLYLGLAEFLNEQPENTRKSAYAVDRNQKHGYKFALGQIDILEMVCSPDTGSVLGYTDNEGAWEPVTQGTGQADEIHGLAVKHFQQAVIDMAAQAKVDLERYAVASDDLIEASQGITKNLMSLRSQTLMDVHLSADPQETFGVGIAKPRNILPTWRTILLSPFSEAKRMELITFLRMNQRHSVVWGRRNESIVKRTALVGLISLALVYKQWFLR